ncbi:MAG: LysR family transcriptional regulator [Comamonas sp.]
MDRLLSMRVFERVVNEGGFAAAARVLDMSAPVVTRLVADLEDHLGTRLLQRSTRRLSLTEAGQSYLGRVRNILQDIDEADAVTRLQSTELEGLLRVHAPPELASYVLAPMLASFRQRYPKIQFDVEVESTGAPPFEEFDITLVGADENLQGELVARKVIETQAILVASPAYLQRHGTPQQPEDLVDHDCLRLKLSNGQTRAWRMWCEADAAHSREIAVKPVIAANHTDTLLRAALDGAGIASVAMDTVAPWLARGELVRVLSPWITGRLVMYAVLPSRKFIPQRTRVFLDDLVEQARAQAGTALRACAACHGEADTQ